MGSLRSKALLGSDGGILIELKLKGLLPLRSGKLLLLA